MLLLKMRSSDQLLEYVSTDDGISKGRLTEEMLRMLAWPITLALLDLATVR